MLLPLSDGLAAWHTARVALHVHQRTTPALGILALASLVALLVFGGLLATQASALLAVLTALAALSLLRLGWTVVRVRGQARMAAEASTACAPNATTSLGPTDQGSAPAFVCRARQGVGTRAREGFVVISNESACFLPSEPWHNALFELALGLVVTRVNLTETSISAIESPALSEEISQAVRVRDGLFLDSSWAWIGGRTWLSQASSKTLLTLRDPVPAALAERWPRQAASPEKLRSTKVRVLRVSLGVVATLLGTGIIAWRLTHNSDYLIAGISFASLVGISVAGGLFVASRVQS